MDLQMGPCSALCFSRSSSIDAKNNVKTQNEMKNEMKSCNKAYG
jgi:hypothetical protein